jgi:hypothetical protein
MQRAERALEFSILQRLERRAFLLDTLLLGEKRLRLQDRRRDLQTLMLEIGEITRLEYLQDGITVARQRIDHLSRIMRLFQMETLLLAQCGLDLLYGSHRYILLSDSEGLL